MNNVERIAKELKVMQDYCCRHIPDECDDCPYAVLCEELMAGYSPNEWNLEDV